MQTGDWGERLRAFRARTQIKQEAAAEALGVSQAYVSRLESGSVVPSSEIVQRLESLLSTPENRAHFDHWRNAIRHCPGGASLLRRHEGHVCVVEISSGLRELGAPFKSLMPGDRLDVLPAGELADWTESLVASGMFEGKAEGLEARWRAETESGPVYLHSQSSPVRDDLGYWYVFTCHLPIGRDAYEAARKQPAEKTFSEPA